MTSTVNSRRSYVALWLADLVLLAVGAILAGIQNVFVTASEPAPNGNYPSIAVFVGGWGAGLLGLGIVTLIVLLFLNAFTGGPLFMRERAQPGDSEPA